MNNPWGRKYTPLPTISLKGKQLEQLGSKTDEYVEVAVNCDESTLRKTASPEIKEKILLEEKVRRSNKKVAYSIPLTSLIAYNTEFYRF